MHQDFDEEGVITYKEGGDYDAVTMTYGERDDNKWPSTRIVLVRPKDEKQSARDWLASQDGCRSGMAGIENL